MFVFNITKEYFYFLKITFNIINKMNKNLQTLEFS